MTRRLSARFITPLRLRMRGRSSDLGAATAEYAVVTVAAAGLGGILIKLITSDWFLEIVKSVITSIVQTVFSWFGFGA